MIKETRDYTKEVAVFYKLSEVYPMHCLDMMTEDAAKYVAGPVHLRLGKIFLYGLGTEKNYKNALICYQKAEAFLYDMVADGDPKYKKSLQAAISGQAKARELLLDELPDDEYSILLQQGFRPPAHVFLRSGSILCNPSDRVQMTGLRIKKHKHRRNRMQIQISFKK